MLLELACLTDTHALFEYQPMTAHTSGYGVEVQARPDLNGWGWSGPGSTPGDPVRARRPMLATDR